MQKFNVHSVHYIFFGRVSATRAKLGRVQLSEISSSDALSAPEVVFFFDLQHLVIISEKSQIWHLFFTTRH